MQQQIAIFWHRRDLRLNDNAGLYHALKSGLPVLPIFIFDENILSKLEDKTDARVSFIHKHLALIKQQLQQLGSDIKVFYGKPLEVFKTLLQTYSIAAVYTNHDYEPYAKQRDGEIENLLKAKNITFNHYKDHCIFEYNEVLKDDGKPYTVFTPYSKKWLTKLNDFYLKSYQNHKYFSRFFYCKPQPMPSLADIGFEPTTISFPPIEISKKIISEYASKRDFPALDATSRLGIHFRFGTISIREKARKALALSNTWVNELIWRDFYMQILANFPHVAEGAFRPEYNNIKWRNNEEEFEAWCNGKTGYPIVDAGMRQLNATGYMHNRVRMIVASFLTKHLLIDWRWGEAYFAKKLLDFDLSANNGGWQWAAGCGTDAAPYFRLFNPLLQTDKFDKEYKYIKQWVPEFGTMAYPKPIVAHDFARKRCLEAYKAALTK
jgi:deoxyribodipyrimidine photo-lyase